MMTSIIKKPDGFTLTEIMVIIVIVGILASVALPRFTGVVERVRAAEGVHILTSLLQAQKAYETENGNFADNPTKLDIEIDRADNFNVGSIVVQDDATNVAQITRTGGYTLSIDEDGTISCTDGAITCARAGF